MEELVCLPKNESLLINLFFNIALLIKYTDASSLFIVKLHTTRGNYIGVYIFFRGREEINGDTFEASNPTKWLASAHGPCEPGPND